MADEKKYFYTTVPNNLRKLLEKLPSLGAPPTASQKWLAGVGFSGGNNQSILPVLRATGVISKSGTPTEYWTALRSGNKAKFADAVRRAYADLFATYPDAYKQDAAALLTFFQTHTSLGEKAQSFCVRTFKVLCEFGDFSAPSAVADELAEAGDDDQDATRDSGSRTPAGGTANGRRSAGTPSPSPIALTVNLQIQLPPSAEGEVYDKLFEAMAKHLKGLISPTE
jgi:hypothetical protein